MCKILNVNKPIIRAYLRHAFAISMLDKKAFDSGWIYDKYIQLEYNKENLENPYINYVDYNFFANDGVFIKQHFLLSLTKDRNQIINFIHDIIDDNFYYFTQWNEMYIKDKAAYKNYDFPHACMIYGYDEKFLYTMGYTTKNWKWTNHKVSNEEFVKAIMVSDWFPDNFWCDTFKGVEDFQWRFSEENMLNELRQYIFGRNNENNNVFYGLAGCKKFAKDINKFSDDGFWIPRPSIYTIVEHKKMMINRINYLINEKKMLELNDMLFSYQKILLDLQTVLLQALKYNISLKKELGKKIANNLFGVFMREEEVVNILYQKLVG